MSKRQGQPSFGDPYELLGLAPGASDAEITKAYRKFALKLHPDKQKGRSLTPAQTEKLNKQFHDIKEARSFLLDPENREWRQKHDAKLASDRLRREENDRREKGMSEHRKKLREELRKKEEEERSKRMNLHRHSDEVGTHRKRRRDDEDHLEKLRKEGNKMREDFAQRAATEDFKNELKQRREGKAVLEDRQVRLKWSRSRIQISPSEHSIANLLSRFGQIENVEMIGSKGNSALVTFFDPSSCRPCVDAYAESDEMRATLVGKRSKEDVTHQDTDGGEHQHEFGETVSTKRDTENLEERKIRQADERERLRRQMEEAQDEESGITEPSEQAQHSSSRSSSGRLSSQLFPVPFPQSADLNNDFHPWQKLEKAEAMILGKILPLEHLRRCMQFSAS